MNAWTMCSLAALLCAPVCIAQSVADRVFPADPDPYMGNYEGRWDDSVDVDPEAAAQIIPLGNDQYEIIVKAKHDMRCPPKFQATTKLSGGGLKWKEDGWSLEWAGGNISGTHDDAKLQMKKVELASPAMGAQPTDPAKAVILFDGKNLDAWQHDKGKPAGWTILPDGAFMVKPGTGEIISKQKFKSVKLHAEFRLPYMPKERGQARGNSGLFFQDVYEVQVLDSFGLEGYTDECGGLYKLSAPRVNACRPPLQWQTYDVEYHAPKFDAAGKLTAYGRLTAYQNGKLIQNNEELLWITGWKEKDRMGPVPQEPGSIRLQDHGNYVQYRNIWLEPLSE